MLTFREIYLAYRNYDTKKLIPIESITNEIYINENSKLAQSFLNNICITLGTNLIVGSLGIYTFGGDIRKKPITGIITNICKICQKDQPYITVTISPVIIIKPKYNAEIEDYSNLSLKPKQWIAYYSDDKFFVNEKGDNLNETSSGHFELTGSFIKW